MLVRLPVCVVHPAYSMLDQIAVLSAAAACPTPLCVTADMLLEQTHRLNLCTLLCQREQGDASRLLLRPDPEVSPRDKDS